MLNNQIKASKNNQRAEYMKMLAIGLVFTIASSPAAAQSLRATGESIFNTIYSLVGVIGGICVLAAGINWKLGGIVGQDPKKYFLNACFGTGLAFGTVGIVQAIKTMVSSGGGIAGV